MYLLSFWVCLICSGGDYLLKIQLGLNVNMDDQPGEKIHHSLPCFGFALNRIRPEILELVENEVSSTLGSSSKAEMCAGRQSKDDLST